MRKKNKYQKHLESLIKKKTKREITHARSLKKKKERRRRKEQKLGLYYSFVNKRRSFYRKHYHKKYNNQDQIVNIPIHFGIEDRENLEQFLEVSSSFIDFSSKKLLLNLADCQYFWPSAVTLFCSLEEWVELAHVGRPPIIQSTTPTSTKTSSYINYCGLYDYVHRPKDMVEDSYYKFGGIVKIKREQDFSLIDQREDEITELLRNNSCLSNNDLESFVCNVLIEIFNNVTEHGISHGNKGYWLIAQNHPTHKFITICIADNGIGIRNSLMTGPQAEIIANKIENISENDGNFIKYAMLEVVSGALDAIVPSVGIMGGQNFPSGSNRGHGLKTIIRTCSELSIEFAILSEHGYVFLDKDGSIIKMGAKEKRVFAGTMYHLKIRALEINK